MDILSNAVFQFVINISIAIILGSISIWIALRQPVQIPLSYEELAEDRVNPSNEDVKKILAKHHKAPDDPTMQFLSFITFKLSNMGKEAITLNDVTKPLIIAFKRDATILSCEKVETVPEDLEYRCQIEEEKISLVLPLLEEKESLTLRILITGHIDDFPDIRIRVGLRKRIVRANNVRFSKEMRFIGIVMLCLATSLILSFELPSPSPNLSQISILVWMCFVGGLDLLAVSWIMRARPPTPRHMLPSVYFSSYFKEFIRSLPILIPFGILLVAVYRWFGSMTFGLVFLIVLCTTTIPGLWYLSYKGVIEWLQKKKRKHNAVLIGLLTAIPFIAIYILFVAYPIFLMATIHSK